MELERFATGLPGFTELRPRVHRDRRGTFVKVFHASAFRDLGLPTDWTEEYWTTSGPRVVRGLHLQLPPAAHRKLVYCVAGSVLDVALDLRRGSPCHRDHAVVELSADRGNAVLLDEGLAHGFAVLEAPATLVYKVTSVYDPSADTGVRWDSAGIDWPVPDPVVSDRDAALPPLDAFDSPFDWEG